jgi:tetratricopeptide (TPR) repeat protein
MQRKLGLLAGTALLLCLGAAPPPAAAQNVAGVSGVVTDQQGKPLADFVVVIKNTDMGTTYSVKTDKNGMYKQIGLRPGVYQLTLKPKDKDQAIVEGLPCAVSLDPDNHCDIDLKKLIASQTAEQEEARKKQEEEQKKFENMKAAFIAGQAKVEEADKARADMMKAPTDQRSAMQPKVNGLYEDALHSFQQAQQAAPVKDPNLHLVYEKLGYANEMLGKYDEAIADYQKAVELKPTSADYYNNLSLALARAGKVPEAMQACEKASSMDPARGAIGWKNLGVVLYNSNHLAEAVEPLKKATGLNPNDADAWYLLGASLLATMQTKQVGEKLTYVVTPGTAEAYQKYVQLAPTGRFATEAKAALQALQSLGAGVDTKVKVRKKGKG